MALEYNSNLVKVATNFSESLKLKVSKYSLVQKLSSNPNFPSLLSLHEVFNKFKIENVGMQVDIDQLEKLPLPFLAHIYISEIGAKDFVNVTNISEKGITYYYLKKNTVSDEEFKNLWSGVVFLAEGNEDVVDNKYYKNKKDEFLSSIKYLLLFTGAIAVLIYRLYISNYFIDLSYINVVIFNSLIAGIFISTLLLIHDIDKSNLFVKNICDGGVKTNCNAVLSSEGAKIFGFSWSEIGFFYFVSMFLFFIGSDINFIDKLTIYSYLSVFSSFFIPFSLYYQFKIVKQWCKLCLVIQFLLLIGLLITILRGTFLNIPTINSTISYMVFLISVIVSWFALKPFFIKSVERDKYFYSYRRIFNNVKVFSVLLEDQPEAPKGWNNLGVKKGSLNPKYTIIKVCSPTCGPCGNAHGIFNELIEFNSEIQLITIYEVKNDDIDDFKYKFVSYILALDSLGNKKDLNDAMNYWYLNTDRTFENMTSRWPVPEDLLEKQKSKINEMRLWCKEAEIEYTPTVFLNGKKLSSDINLIDLKDIL